MQSLLLNGKVFYYDEIAAYSFRNSIPINGYEAKTLELCRDWLTGVQEFAIQTSGSTGAPKVITLTRQQLEASARSTIKALQVEKNDRVLVCLNTETVGGLMLLVRAFIADMQLTIIEPTSNPLLVLPPESAFEYASFVPMQMQEMLAFSPLSLPFFNQMKAILIGGAAVSNSLQAKLQHITAPVYHTYGMTETASHVALRRLNGLEASPYFKALPGIKLGTDERGCLTISGEVTNQETIVTNDQVQLLDQETFEWLGRVDFVINSGGVKIQAEKVEQILETALAQMGLVVNSFISALPDEKLGEKVVAVIEQQPLDQIRESQLRDILQSLLTRYEVPKLFLYLPEFKRTPSGKMDRNQSVKLAQTYSLNSRF
ncbi:AMP-binding protein [Adhaeribacter soli]|uniref:AMP-binding protein n=1 Tax=Adhaeribacter soli TaxID=2607655 RepID=A0A5N1J5I3_9BACT|nr:AMP-binding protein [Adhaeribacter soli]KAA9345987.1 AMP-binding protein [Adhaeribacter soli]